MQNIQNQIDLFIEKTNSNITKYFEANFPMNDIPQVHPEYGTQYCKIVKTDKSSRSVFCFIALRDGKYKSGDILKAASWKAPANGARGNIFDSLDRGINAYGAEYLR